MARATVDCCYSVQKRNAPSSRGKAQRGLKCMLPSERSQSEKPASVTLWKRQKLRRRQKEQRRPGRRDGERDTPERDAPAEHGGVSGPRKCSARCALLCRWPRVIHVSGRTEHTTPRASAALQPLVTTLRRRAVSSTVRNVPAWGGVLTRGRGNLEGKRGAWEISVPAPSI